MDSFHNSLIFIVWKSYLGRPFIFRKRRPLEDEKPEMDFCNNIYINWR